ncbi:LPD38 domain-containing protein [Methylocella sp. CPCC 101449]|uniref:LPD38 domain-containing protein n=1 Tax=Methylocella sp. CPCC 101449 TaxID=2987531 RepID=UPI00288DC656|nr:LPD38 domain-containing protein [Methylocella sp. CPCC 101449]MDT2024547.1 hypothetical protein [Methylocella sp. CPCC 101449]
MDDLPNPFDKFDAEEPAAPTLGERFSGNALSSRVGGTLFGAAGQAASAYVERNAPDLARQSQEEAEAYRNSDPTPMEGETPLQAQARSRAAFRRDERGVPIQSLTERNAELRGELARYEAMPAASGIMENAVALAGQLAGGMTSPEAIITRIPGLGRFIGTGATTASHIAEAAITNAAVNTATDPIAQGLNIAGGIRDHYDPVQTALAPIVGGAIGGGLAAVPAAARAVRERFRPGAPAPTDPAPQSVFIEDPLARRPGDAMIPPQAENVPAVTPLPAEPQPAARPASPALPDALELAARGELTPDRARAIGKEVGTSARDTETQILGPEADEWRKLQRQMDRAANSADDKKAAQIEQRIGKIEDRLSPADRDRLYGVGESDTADPKGWNELAGKLDEATTSREGAVSVIASEVRSLPNNIEPKAMTVTERNSIAVIRQAIQSEEARGGDAMTLLKDAFEERFSRYGKSADGVEVVTGQMERLATLMNAPPPAAPRPGLQFREAGKSGIQFNNPPARPESAAVPGERPIDAAVRSLQQQAFDLADALDHPLRQGRLAKSSALGQYDMKQGVARVRNVADFETVAHESGHFLEQKIGADMSALIQRHATELGRLDYDPSQMRPSEGFAEFTRLYLTGPAAAKHMAPNFYRDFRDFMAIKQPELLQKLDTAQLAYQTWVNAPTGEKLDAMVIRQETDGIGKSIHEEGLAETVRLGLSAAYRATVDDKSPVTNMVRMMTRAIKEQTGKVMDLKHADNPDILLRLAERAHQGAAFDMQHGVRAYGSLEIGPSLYSAISTAVGDPRFGKWDDAKVKAFEDYLVAKRGIVLYDKYDAGTLSNRPMAMSRADLEAHIAAAEAANPTWAEAAVGVHSYTRAMLTKQYESGQITKDLFDKLAAEPFYVPLFRDMTDKPQAGGGSGVGKRSGRDGPGVVDTIKRMRGSDRDIISPIQGLMTQTFLVNRTIAHNDAIRAVVRLADQAGPAAGRWVERVPSKEMKGKTFDVAEGLRAAGKKHGVDPDDMEVLTGALTDVFGDDPLMATIYRPEIAGKRGEPILFYREGGELKAVRFADSKEGLALYESFAQLPNVASDLIVNVIGAGSQLLRSGVVSNPVFVATNYIRDQGTVFVMRPDFIPFLDGLRGTVKEVAQSDAALLYAAAGGVTPGAAVGSVDKIIEGDIQALAKKGYLVNRLTSFHGALELAGVTETGTRIGVYDRVYSRELAAGRSPAEALIAAAWEATDTMDFSRHGSKMNVWTRLVPFFRASIVGLDKASRTMVAPLLRAATGDINTVQDQQALRNAALAWIKAGVVYQAMGFLWAWMFGDRDAYRDADATLKATHLVLPLGAGKVAVVPKPFEVGLGFNLGEEAYARFVQNDPRAVDRLTEALSEQLLQPFNPARMLMGVPGVKTAYELALNRNAFTGRDIVPQPMKNIPKNEQYMDQTSPIAKAIARGVNATAGAFSEKGVISPLQVDHIAGSMFGLYGRDLMAASKMVESKIDEAATPGWEDTVAARRFVKSEMTARDTTRKFWDVAAMQTGEYAGAKTHYEALVARFRDQEAKNYLNTLNTNERAFVTLSSAINPDTGRQSFTADDRRLHPAVRGGEAARILTGLAGDLRFNRQTQKLTGDRMTIAPDVRGQLIDQIKTLAVMEMQRTLTVLDNKGYANRPLPPVDQQFEVIRSISPEVAEEIAQRYAQGKVYKFDAVQRAWPETRSRLNGDGSSAIIGDLRADVSSEGFEFEAQRISKRAPRRRLEIEGAKPR